jgi:hypothetical protein
MQNTLRGKYGGIDIYEIRRIQEGEKVRQDGNRTERDLEG